MHPFSQMNWWRMNDAKQSIDGQVFIEQRPMNSVTGCHNSEVVALFF
jgi:hypothetical protein